LTVADAYIVVEPEKKSGKEIKYRYVRELF
jgi:hypothetical protein